jgi:3-deoxy-D-manno-octulosonic-acid transferase
MVILYDLVNVLFIIISLPVFLFKKKMHPGFDRRLGVYPRTLEFRRPVWIHAVSVGEMVNMRRLFQGLCSFSPGSQFVFSTVTPTGNKIARSIARAQDFVTYLPLDISCIVNKVLNRVRPRVFIVAETEIWPNVLLALHRRGIPVIIVNGRISDKAISGYRKVRWLIAPLLRGVSIWCMQSEVDAQRIISLGARPETVKVTGNMKFDQHVVTSVAEGQELKRKLGLGREDECIVAGSTHPGEESQVMQAFQQVAAGSTSVRLLIAPRHPQRSLEVAECVRKYGFEPQLISRLNGPSPSGARVFIIDTIGELLSYYAIADVVFVGGSLIKHGGQNFLEPAFLGKPVIVGPSLHNFRDISRQFLCERAAVLVHNANELAHWMQVLLTDRQQAAGFVSRSQNIIARNLGATDRNISYIKEFMPNPES